jgi:hypothetical protein
VAGIENFTDARDAELLDTGCRFLRLPCFERGKPVAQRKPLRCIQAFLLPEQWCDRLFTG